MRPPFIMRHREPETCRLGKHSDHDHITGCYRCHQTWCFTEGHSTWYPGDDGPHGMFPLCEDCWSGLTVEQRLPYYHELHFGDI